jgi:hypothetical protein
MMVIIKKVIFRHSLIYCLGSFVISKHSFVANEDSGWLIFFFFFDSNITLNVGQTVPATERNHVIEQYVTVEAGEINMVEKNAE